MNDDQTTAPVNSTPVIDTPTAAAPEIPGDWPGAFGAYKHSKQIVKQNLGTLVVLWLLGAIVSGAVSWQFKQAGDLLSLIFGSLFTAGLTLTFLAGLRGEKVSLGQALKDALPFWVNVILLNILVSLSLLVSALLLIIPFFFVLPRLLLVNYFLIDKKLGVIDAYKASWYGTKGHSLKAWGIILATIAMALPLFTIIGIPVAIYLLIMYSAAFTVLYAYIGKQPQTAPAAASAPEPVQDTPAVPEPVNPPPTDNTPPAGTSNAV